MLPSSHQVSYQTQLGQMLDLVSNPQGREKEPGLLNKFNLDLYADACVTHCPYCDRAEH